MKLSARGIDLEKTVFQVNGVDLHGKPCLRRQLRRAEMLTFFVKLEPCSLVWKPVAALTIGRAG